MALLDVRELSVGYYTGADRPTPALDGIGFRLDKGQTLGVVGESGCGKTTLARALMAYCRPGAEITGGEVLFEGEDVLKFDTPKLRRLRGRRIAIVPQNPLGSLTYHMKVGPQVDEILRDRSGRRAARHHQMEGA